MPERREPDEGLVARQIADVILTHPTGDQFELIRSFMDDRAKIEPSDLFTFRVVGSSNGLDSYFTRQAQSSMDNFVQSYGAGQSLMGSHATREFSYGNSFAGEQIDADPLKRNFEAAFYRKYASLAHLRATKWVVADYYMRRGISLNGQPVDDLIKAMEAGVVRKASVSFYVGQYRCGIDGQPMVEDFFGPMGDGEKCEHFPGVEYKDAGVAWADMEDNDLLETSMVYKNASPGAMLLRKAEGLAVRGLLPAADIARIEERFAHALPRFERRVFTGVNKEEIVPVTDEERAVAAAAEAEAAEAAAAATAASEHEEEGGQETGPTVEELQAQLAEANERLGAYDAREAALTDALGGEAPTVEALRSLKRSSQLGDELYLELVDEAVKARVGVQSDKFNVEGYRAMLMRERNVALVREERDSYAAQKQELFKPGRQVQPSAIQPDKGARKTATDDGPNILAPRTK